MEQLPLLGLGLKPLQFGVHVKISSECSLLPQHHHSTATEHYHGDAHPDTLALPVAGHEAATPPTPSTEGQDVSQLLVLLKERDEDIAKQHQENIALRQRIEVLEAAAAHARTPNPQAFSTHHNNSHPPVEVAPLASEGDPPPRDYHKLLMKKLEARGARLGILELSANAEVKR